ncbi:unnamed protein product [Prorocentrum cordatum]|uniref:Uncharacterized protein n=1 Tax=Prorocentrum cordatum TaxID=2364126 RepID=A0ABN9TUL5_9DINO|nr:unnamed protein product [Polarella glacialis]
MEHLQFEVLGSLKVPPAWSPEQDNAYPFRFWLTDVTTWAAAAARDVKPEQPGPAVALRLGGAAHSLTSFAPLGEESELRATQNWLGFTRRGPENIDQTLSRFEVVRRRAATLGNFAMGPQGLNPIGRDSNVVKCMAKGCESEFHLIKDCPRKQGKGGSFITDGARPLTGAGAGAPWIGFNTGSAPSGPPSATPAHGAGSVIFFATDNAVPMALESSASVAGAKCFTGVAIALAQPSGSASSESGGPAFPTMNVPTFESIAKVPGLDRAGANYGRDQILGIRSPTGGCCIGADTYGFRHLRDKQDSFSIDLVEKAPGDAENPAIEVELEIDLSTLDPGAESHFIGDGDSVGCAKVQDCAEGTKYDMKETESRIPKDEETVEQDEIEREGHDEQRRVDFTDKGDS